MKLCQSLRHSGGMDRVAEYLERAAKADAMAERMSDPDLRRQFQQLAGQWRDLARQSAQLARRNLPDDS